MNARHVEIEITINTKGVHDLRKEKYDKTKQGYMDLFLSIWGQAVSDDIKYYKLKLLREIVDTIYIETTGDIDSSDTYAITVKNSIGEIVLHLINSRISGIELIIREKVNREANNWSGKIKARIRDCKFERAYRQIKLNLLIDCRDAVYLKNKK